MDIQNQKGDRLIEQHDQSKILHFCPILYNCYCRPPEITTTITKSITYFLLTAIWALRQAITLKQAFLNIKGQNYERICKYYSIADLAFRMPKILN